MRRIFFFVIILLISLPCCVMAEPIGGRFGITGKVGAIVPVRDSELSGTTLETSKGLATGGSLILGFCSNFAAELDVTHVPKMDMEVSGAKKGEASITDISLGLQYRISPEKHMVPYIGAGVDFIKGDLDLLGNSYTIDWAIGGHVNAGIDYFVTKGIAFVVDARAILADKNSINFGDTRVGSFDPVSFVGTVGIRLFLPENAFR